MTIAAPITITTSSKPHIWLQGGEWMCGKRIEFGDGGWLRGYAGGWGDSPRSAYFDYLSGIRLMNSPLCSYVTPGADYLRSYPLPEARIWL